MIFGAIMAAGVIGMIIAPLVSRMLRFFPSVVTGTIILVIGVTLMRIGINWIFGNPVGPTAPQIVDPAHADWLKASIEAAAAAGTPAPEGIALAAKVNNPAYAAPGNIAISALVLLAIVLIARFGKGFVANISVLLGIVIGGIVAAALGMMSFAKVGEAAWFGLITPFHFGMPIFDPVMVITMSLVMVVVMIESTGIRILAKVDFTSNRNNLFIVAVSLGFGMIPLIAPNFKQWMPHNIHPLIESGILLATITAVVLNAMFNGAKGSEADAKAAALQADH